MNKPVKIVGWPGTNRLGKCLPKAVYLVLSVFMLWSTAAWGQGGTYTWKQGDGSNFTDPTRWVPTRNNPSTTDILIFDGNVTPFATCVLNFGNNTQTIGRLVFTNKAQVDLRSLSTGNDASLLLIGGGTPSDNNDDLFVQAGSKMNLSATTSDLKRYVVVRLLSGRRARVDGTVQFNSNNASSRLVGTDPGAINFTSGSVCIITHIEGSPFGTTGGNTLPNTPAPYTDVTVAGAVSFAAGARFNQLGGTNSNPFGTGTSDASGVATFSSGSFYGYTAGTLSPVGRTYGNLEIIGNGADVAGTNPFVVLNDLTLTSGQANINVTGAGISVGGKITAPGGTLNCMPASASSLSVTGTTSVGPGRLTFSPAVTGTANFTGDVTVNSGGVLTFGGATANVNLLGNLINNATLAFAQTATSRVCFKSTLITQKISGTSAIVFGPKTQFEILNPNGMKLERPVTANGGLLLTMGNLTTDATNLLTMPAAATISGGSDGSFVNGPMARTATGGAASLFFPVGKVGASGGRYRPLTLNISAQAGGPTVAYRAEEIEVPPTQNVAPGVNHVSFRRYFNITPSPAPTAFVGTVTLSFGPDDFVNAPADPGFVVAKRNAPANWTSIGRSGNTGAAVPNGTSVAGTLTSGTFTSFSDFTLASTTGTPGVNPLPVELTRFAATATPSGVGLEWATASEKNSAYFEVQRSATGQVFEALTTVPAQGTSTAAHAYAALDRAPLAGLAYYRLRQVDANGTASFSPVVSVRWLGVAGLHVYPNPSTGTLYLSGTAGPVRYRVLNCQGQTLQAGEAAGPDGVDVKRLPGGMYLLEISTENGRSLHRFVRQ